MTSDVAKAWQDSQPRQVATNDHQSLSAGQPHKANEGSQAPLSVPRFPWYY